MVSNLAKKKIPAREFIIKLREAVINIVKVTRELQANMSELEKRISRIEKSLQYLDSRIKKMEESILPTHPQKIMKEPEIPAVEEGAEVLGEPEFIELAKELGVELSESGAASEEIPTPPPVPPIEETKEVKETKKPESMDMGLSTIRGAQEAKTEELKKEKDELLKALEELDII